MLRRYVCSLAASMAACRENQHRPIVEQQRHQTTPATAAKAAVPFLLISGDASKGVKSSDDSVCIVSDVAGTDVDGGTLLKLIDLCAARAACKHVLGYFVSSRLTAAKDSVPSAADVPVQYGTATVSMDSIVFRHPVAPGDVIRCRGNVVACGQSSLVVNVMLARTQFPTRDLQPVANATVHMVAIGPDLRPAKVVPAIGLTTQHLVDLNRYVQSTRELAKVNAAVVREHASRTSFDVSELEDEANKRKLLRIAIADTRHEASCMFFQGHLNVNGTVFGGEILDWMEKHAVVCGQFFAKNRSVKTLCVHSLEFKKPIYHTDWVFLTAHVVYVHNSTMEVDVEISVDRKGERLVTNTGSFVLISFDSVNRPLAIDCGLDLTSLGTRLHDADPLNPGPLDLTYWQRRYALAKYRCNYVKAHNPNDMMRLLDDHLLLATPGGAGGSSRR